VATLDPRADRPVRLGNPSSTLAASSDLFRLLIDSIEDHGIVMLDAAGHVATWNPGAEQLYGHRADEIIGRHMSVLYPEPDVRAGRCEHELDVPLRCGRFAEDGWRLRKDGTRFRAHVSITAVRDEDDALVGFATIARAIDAPPYRALIDGIDDDAVFILDPAGQIATWNPGAERIHGYAAADIVGRHVSVLHLEDDVHAGACEQALELASRQGRYRHEGWRLGKDGARIWASEVLTALRDDGDALTGFGVVIRDLTERRRTEEARAASEARTRLLIESVQDYAIFMLDPDGNVASWNPGAQRIKGYRADEIIGSHFSRFYPPEEIRAGKCEHELACAARTGRFEDEGWRLRQDGTRFWANVVISAVRDHDGTLVGFAKITRDLTERKQVEEETAARLAAEKANRTKDEFLAMLGHELRNPLAPIVSALQLLKLRGDHKSAREHQIIERQVNQMIRLVDDLLDVSRIARGKIVLKRASFDLRDALAKASEMVIPQFELREQSFQVTAPHHPLAFDGDESRLVQVFANLLANAARYTPPGGRIEVEVDDATDELVIKVKDNGAGIDAELLPRIFDLFVQGYQTVERSNGGLGLGLTLVREIVELHGGRVEASSRGRGHGSTFTVRLPVGRAVGKGGATPAAAMAPAAPAAPRRVLVVDDNEDALTLLVDMLRTLGHQVVAAAHAEAALAALETFEPDIAILDIGLPGMDGYGLAQRIRAHRVGRATRIVALTGYTQHADKERGARAGFDAHLAKPVGLAQILAQIAQSPDLSGAATRPTDDT
jgi:PAS domain S-box-containing protein